MSTISSSVKKKDSVTRNLSVSVAPEEVAAERKRAYGRIRSKVEIKGFRKGKAPDSVLAERFGDEVDEDVVRALVERACRTALDEQGLEPVVTPRVTSHELDEERGLSFEAQVEIRPEFKLRKYKGLKGVRRVVTVTDEQVAKFLGSLRERAATLETEEGRVNVETGDVVRIDLVALVDGMPVDKASGEGVQLEVGAGQFPEEFDKQIVGVTRGIETPILVRFADDHGDPDLAGQMVRFNTTVRAIMRKVLPSLDDDLPGELGIDDCPSLDELRAKLREELESRSSADADRHFRDTLLEQLVDKHSFDVPGGLVEARIMTRLRSMGLREISRDKFDELKSTLEPAAEKDVRASLLLDAIVGAENIEVEAEELERAVTAQVQAAGEGAEQMRRYFEEPGARTDLEVAMQREKALALVAEQAKRTDEEVSESQVAALSG